MPADIHQGDVLWEPSAELTERSALWEFFDVQASRQPAATLASRSMLGAVWFPGRS